MNTPIPDMEQVSDDEFRVFYNGHIFSMFRLMGKAERWDVFRGAAPVGNPVYTASDPFDGSCWIGAHGKA